MRAADDRGEGIGLMEPLVLGESFRHRPETTAELHGLNLGAILWQAQAPGLAITGGRRRSRGRLPDRDPVTLCHRGAQHRNAPP